jgi:hypothetical protein
MKTLREVLLEKHQAVEPKLDAIREQVTAGLAAGTTDAPARAKEMVRSWQPDASTFQISWRRFLWSLRWHLAGLSAVWLVVLFLNVDRTPDLMQGATRRDAPTPRQLLAALRENQRQLRELIAAPASEPAPEPPKLTPSPRSEIRPSSTAAA